MSKIYQDQGRRVFGIQFIGSLHRYYFRGNPFIDESLNNIAYIDSDSLISLGDYSCDIELSGGIANYSPIDITLAVSKDRLTASDPSVVFGRLPKSSSVWIGQVTRDINRRDNTPSIYVDREPRLNGQPIYAPCHFYIGSETFYVESIAQVIETGEGDLKEEIKLMHSLAQKMRQERFSHGAITFDKVEVKFKLDEHGMPVDVYLKENKDSNKLIEEFMLLANKRVAAFVGQKLSEEKGSEQTFVYRVHDKPLPEKLENFSFFASKFGHKIKTNSEKAIAQSLNQLMKDIKGKREENVLEQLAIRTMAKAVYTTQNIGHYGLAFDFYTHFTSPIRRYPDVMVHRLLTHYLNNGKSVEREGLEERCKHSTDMEIKASEAERSSVKFKQAQYLMGREGEVFDGMISGVTEWGIYVELIDSKCEGLIRVRDLKDDYYDLDEANYCLVGRRTNRRFQLGDPVRVKLKSADLLKKQIDFIMWDFNSADKSEVKERRVAKKKDKPRGFAKPASKKGKRRR